MCYAASCNPACGKCRPKRIVEIACPECGAPNSITREEYLLLFDLPHRKSILDTKLIERGGIGTPSCKACGRDLTLAYEEAVNPAPCHLQRIICGFPCGRSIEPHKDDTPPCRTMVPLGKLEDGE